MVVEHLYSISPRYSRRDRDSTIFRCESHKVKTAVVILGAKTCLLDRYGNPCTSTINQARQILGPNTKFLVTASFKHIHAHPINLKGVLAYLASNEHLSHRKNDAEEEEVEDDDSEPLPEDLSKKSADDSDEVMTVKNVGILVCPPEHYEVAAVSAAVFGSNKKSLSRHQLKRMSRVMNRRLSPIHFERQNTVAKEQQPKETELPSKESIQQLGTFLMQRSSDQLNTSQWSDSINQLGSLVNQPTINPQPVNPLRTPVNPYDAPLPLPTSYYDRLTAPLNHPPTPPPLNRPMATPVRRFPGANRRPVINHGPNPSRSTSAPSAESNRYLANPFNFRRQPVADRSPAFNPQYYAQPMHPFNRYPVPFVYPPPADLSRYFLSLNPPPQFQ